MRKTPVVLGVLSIVFGALVALWSAFALLSQRYMSSFSSELMGSMGHRPGGPDPMEMMRKLTEVQQQLAPVLYTISGGMVALSLILVAVGLGLYRRQPWSRPASLMWAFSALAFIPVRIYLEVAIVQPRMIEVLRQTAASQGLPSGMMESMIGMQKGLVMIVSLIFYAPFPILLLVLMGRSSARNDLVT
jgi:hypothetical protein